MTRHTPHLLRRVLAHRLRGLTQGSGLQQPSDGTGTTVPKRADDSLDLETVRPAWYLGVEVRPTIMAEESGPYSFGSRVSCSQWAFLPWSRGSIGRREHGEAGGGRTTHRKVRDTMRLRDWVLAGLAGLLLFGGCQAMVLAIHVVNRP